MKLGAFTNDVRAIFTEKALEFVEDGGRPLTFPYREHPEVFGHPRLLMADFHKSAALVRMALLHLKGNRIALIAPRIIFIVQRQLDGGLTEIDKRMLSQIFMEAGVRKVEFLGN